VIQITDAAWEPLYLQAALSIGLVRPARFRASVILEGSMVIRTIAYASAFAGTVAIGLAAPASSQTRAPAREEARYAPIQSISYDFGSKSMSGYFVQDSAKCVVTLMVSEKVDPDAVPSTTATRVRLALIPGQTAGLDSDEGRSLNFTCGEGANALLVEAGEREKLVELQTLGLRQTAANSPRN
jgi:hypothetical protein